MLVKACHAVSTAMTKGQYRVTDAIRVGLISDTHGRLRPQALQALAGVDEIIHAGDIGGPEVIEGLRAVAPVHAVRGNNDRGPWAAGLPETLTLRLGGVGIHVLHDLKELGAGSGSAGLQVIVAGHSHRPSVIRREGVLLVNPGSAGPRRFKLPVTIGYLTLVRGCAAAEIRDLL
jgi:putative phosphoesterase